jgi:DNA-binding protein Fis
MAEGLGNLTGAGRTYLTFVEEHGGRRVLPASEIYEAYLRADGLLEDTQDPEDVSRLRACVRLVMRRLAGMRLNDRNFSLYGAVHELESKLLTNALNDAGGSVTKAARLLGVPHQTLGTMLSARHRRLSEKRTPAKKRKRSIIKGA